VNTIRGRSYSRGLGSLLNPGFYKHVRLSFFFRLSIVISIARKAVLCEYSPLLGRFVLLASLFHHSLSFCRVATGNQLSAVPLFPSMPPSIVEYLESHGVKSIQSHELSAERLTGATTTIG